MHVAGAVVVALAKVRGGAEEQSKTHTSAMRSPLLLISISRKGWIAAASAGAPMDKGCRKMEKRCMGLEWSCGAWDRTLGLGSQAEAWSCWTQPDVEIDAH